MKQNSDKRTRFIVYTLAGIFLGVFLVYGIIYKFPTLFQETVTRIERDITVTDEGIADAVEKVFDSVVIVSNYQNGKAASFGSGFLYKIDDKKSYFITKQHVIANGEKFTVTYSDGSILNAKVVGSDVYADIAVLEVQTKDGIEAVSIGKTDTLRVGDTTFTVGAPISNIYSWTVTRGIISGKERLVEVSINSNSNDGYIMNVLQTDAAVNSGNSGGPLCNSNGEVIGVISAKLSASGVEGIGFAIPIEVAIEKAEQFIKGEETSYPYIGISMASVSQIMSYPQYYQYISNTNITSGVMILDTQKGSGAEAAKLQTGDVITKVNDKQVTNVAYLRYELYKYKVGDTIEITYMREGRENKAKVTLTSKIA